MFHTQSLIKRKFSNHSKFIYTWATSISNNSIESQSPLSWILAGPCFANNLTVLLWVFRNRLTSRVYRHPVNTTHLYDFIQCWTNVEDVGPTLYKCYTNVLCLLGRRTFSQTLYISAMLAQCWASVADVGLTLNSVKWVSRWSSIQSSNQVTSSTTLYCMLKAYTHASLEPDSIFNDPVCLRSPPRVRHRRLIYSLVSHINVEQTYCIQCKQLDDSSMLVQTLLRNPKSTILISRNLVSSKSPSEITDISTEMVI